MDMWKASVLGQEVIVKTNLDLHPSEDFEIDFKMPPRVGDYVVSKKVWRGISQLKLIVSSIVHEEAGCFVNLINWQPDFDKFYRGLTRS